MKTRNICWGIIVIVGFGMFAAKTWAWQASQASDLDASIARGKTIYNTQCVTCHKEKGEGIKEVYPPLANSDYLMADKERSIGTVVNGATGEITVNGVKYDGEMVNISLTDDQVSDVLNYVRNSWGNKGEAVKPEEVAPQKKQK
jgi:mono/diheme cytochrome c family protein